LVQVRKDDCIRHCTFESVELPDQPAEAKRNRQRFLADRGAQVLVDELKTAGVLAKDAHAASVDELLSALEGTSGGAARPRPS
jgi:hypothetical protein